ncbi:putative transporter [Xylariaceae sp. FL0594]|nr:putative transporter [Xylariaceae sp. FL0594]
MSARFRRNSNNNNNNNGAAAALDRIEAPVTWKAYVLCAFAAFGGIFFGYDSGYISGVMAMPYFVHVFKGEDLGVNGSDGPQPLGGFDKAAVTSFLSLGTFIGSLVAGDLADRIGRRAITIAACVLFSAGVVVQCAASTIPTLIVGRTVAGLGMGGVSAVLVLYMSEIAPRKVRGAIVSAYQFCITLGLLLASIVDYCTQYRLDTGAYRIPIAIQLVWAIVLGTGLFFLPESPRYYVRQGQQTKAAEALSRLRGHAVTSQYVRDELAGIVANHEHETATATVFGTGRGGNNSNSNGYFTSWMACFRGSLWNGSSNLRRTLLGISLQMMSQLTGVNFIFYFANLPHFHELGTIQDPFLISLVTTLVNVLSTPLSFYAIERFGRRRLLLWGAIGMIVSQFLVAAIGEAMKSTMDILDPVALSAMITFICLFIFFFATTWGPVSWTLTGELFPLPIRARAVALSTASNWFWNFIIAFITPYMVDPVSQGGADLGSRVFFIWGSLCFLALVYTYYLVPETRGLTLEQIDKMLAETTARGSSKWYPSSTYADFSDPNSDDDDDEDAHGRTLRLGMRGAVDRQETLEMSANRGLICANDYEEDVKSGLVRPNWGITN